MKEEEKESPKNMQPEDRPEYVLTIPGEQFHQMRGSGILGDMLEEYEVTEEGEYNVTLTAEQYTQFQDLVNHDTTETVSQAQAEQQSTKKGKSKRKDKKSKSKALDTDPETASPGGTPKIKRKSSRLGRWGSRSSIKQETSGSEGDPNKKRKKSFSFSKKRKESSADEEGEKKRKSSVFGRRKKKSEPPPPPPEEIEAVQPEREPQPEFGVWPNIQTRLGDTDDPSLSLANESKKTDENVKEISSSGSNEEVQKSPSDPRSRIPKHLDYKTKEPEDRNKRTYILEPEVLKPDYRAAAEQPGYYRDGNGSPDEVTDVSEYSVVSYPIIGRRKRKRKNRTRRPAGGTYNSDVGCFECFIMIFCPWRWVSSR